MSLLLYAASLVWDCSSDELPKGKSLAVIAHTYGLMKDRSLAPATESSLDFAVEISNLCQAPIFICADSERDPLEERDLKRDFLYSRRFSYGYKELDDAKNAIQEAYALKAHLDDDYAKYEGIVAVCEAFQAKRLRLIYRHVFPNIPVYFQVFEGRWPRGNWNVLQSTKVSWVVFNVVAYYVTRIIGVERLKTKQVGIRPRKENR